VGTSGGPGHWWPFCRYCWLAGCCSGAFLYTCIIRDDVFTQSDAVVVITVSWDGQPVFNKKYIPSGHHHHTSLNPIVRKKFLFQKWRRKRRPGSSPFGAGRIQSKSFDGPPFPLPPCQGPQPPPDGFCPSLCRHRRLPAPWVFCRIPLEQECDARRDCAPPNIPNTATAQTPLSSLGELERQPGPQAAVSHALASEGFWLDVDVAHQVMRLSEEFRGIHGEVGGEVWARWRQRDKAAEQSWSSRGGVGNQRMICDLSRKTVNGPCLVEETSE
jgi:hypothetical protein